MSLGGGKGKKKGNSNAKTLRNIRKSNAAKGKKGSAKKKEVAF